MKFCELEGRYEKADAYVKKAIGFEGHADRPWINDATLGRWYLGGISEVVGNFLRDSDGEIEYESLKERVNATPRITFWQSRLGTLACHFKEELKSHYGEDEFVRTAELGI